jgi:hypothetical protein
MEISSIEVAAVLLGFLLRLGIPIALTFLLAMFLKWLDKRWQAEAEREKTELQVLVQNGQELRPCWEIYNCPENLRKNCKAYANPAIPCWEVYRVNGHLKPACQSCKVLPADIPGRIVMA